MRLAPIIAPEILEHADKRARLLGFTSRPAYIAHLLAVPAPLPDLPPVCSLGKQVTLRVSDDLGEALTTAASSAGMTLRDFLSRLLMR